MTDDFAIPPGSPIWTEADVAPMPPEHKAGNCPHCGTALRSSGTRQKDGDYGVCSYCFETVIWDAGDWRIPTYDEAFFADQDVRVQIARAAFRAPLPGPEDDDAADTTSTAP